MKIAIFIPIKTRSTRVESKNFKWVGGIPLFDRAFRTAERLGNLVKRDESSGIERVEFFVDTDSDIIKDWVKDNYKFEIIDRKSRLAEDSATGNDLLKYHVDKFPNFDVYCQLYITCPFQTAESLKGCLDKLKGDEFDSAFTVHTRNTWFWYKGQPINYTPRELCRSQDIQHLISHETTGFYAIKKDAYNVTKCRIGERPYLHDVSFKESIDIDTDEDLDLANALADSDL